MTRNRCLLAGKPEEMFVYTLTKCSNGTGIITVCDGHGGFPEFQLIGSSVVTSGQTGEWVGQLSVYPEPGKSGVVVLSCFSTKQNGKTALAVALDWKRDKLIISRGEGEDRFWNPDRIGQVYAGSSESASWIEVQIGKRRFTGNPNRAVGNTHFVSDGDILCRYWAGNIGPEKVLAAAVRTKMEKTATQKLREQLEEAQAMSTSLEEQCLSMQKEREELIHRVHAQAAEIDQNAKSAAKLANSARYLAKRLKQRLWLSEDDKATIREVLNPK